MFESKEQKHGKEGDREKYYYQRNEYVSEDVKKWKD
jgi:hypothetical protein